MTTATVGADERDEMELRGGRAVLGAILGYLVFNAVVWLFRMWAGADWAGGGDGVQDLFGLHALSDWSLVGASGAVLGALGGLLGFQIYRGPGVFRAMWGAALGYAVAAAVLFLVRAAFGMDVYSARPTFLFGSLGSMLFFFWGIGAWWYWFDYTRGVPTPEHEDHSGHGARSWKSYFTFNTDHKVIGIQYLVTNFFFMLIGGAMAEFVRAELANPGLQYASSGEVYNGAFTMHGAIMLFLFIIPVFAGIANFVLPIMIGAPDMAYPRLNALSFWMLAFGGCFFLASVPLGMPEAGWTNYAPLSSANGGGPLPIGELFFMLGIQFVGSSSILTAINFLVTIISMRAPGMTMWRMPLLVWANFTTSLLVVFGTPFIAGSQLMVMFDGVMGTRFFESVYGGDGVTYQHVFWFYSHPAVYIMMLPGFGIISEVITTHARKPLFGYKALAISTLAIGFLGFTVWAHHMFTSGMAPWLRLPMMITTMLIAVPTGIKVLGWSATLWGGRIHLRTPMLFAIGFLFTFTVGGLTGVMLAAVPFDLHVQDTYFVVAHFHYVLFGGSVMTVFAGIYHWFPKMTGRMFDEQLGRWHFWLTFVGLNLTFFPMHWVGTLGMNRRVADYQLLSEIHPAVHGWNIVITCGALIQGVAYVVFLYNMVSSWRSGPVAPANPWRSHSLEWLVSSPPPLFNFYDTPRVIDHPYDFGKVGAQHAIVATAPGVYPEPVPTTTAPAT